MYPPSHPPPPPEYILLLYILLSILLLFLFLLLLSIPPQWRTSYHILLSYLASYDVASNLCQALLSGTAISSATVGIPATFTVNTRDAFGNAYVDKPGGGTWYSPYDGPARFAVILKNIRKGVEVPGTVTDNKVGRCRLTPG